MKFFELTEERQKTFLNQIKKTDTPRKSHFRNRLAIVHNEYKHLIVNRLRETYADIETIKEISAFVLGVTNIANRVADAVCKGYQEPPRRELTKARKKQVKQFSEFLESTKINIQSKLWLKMAFLLNVVFIVPRPKQTLEGTKLAYDMITPDRSDVILDEDEEDVLILGYPNKLHVDGDELDVLCVLDEEAWHYFDLRTFEHLPALRRDHGIGFNPTIALRVSLPTSGYYDQRRGNLLEKATVEMERYRAEQNWARHSQNKFFISVIGASIEDKAVVTQMLHPYLPLGFNADPNDLAVNINNYVLTIDEFVKERKDMGEGVIESYGLPSHTVTFDYQSNDTPSGVLSVVSYEKLAEIRADQIEFLREFEHRLMFISALVAKNTGVENFSELDPVLIKQKFNVTWDPLTFLDHPDKKLDYFLKLYEIGVIGPDAISESIWRQRKGTEAEMERIKQNLKNRSELIQFQTNLNKTGKPEDDFDGSAQENGRMGGFIKARKRKEEEVNNDN